MKLNNFLNDLLTFDNKSSHKTTSYKKSSHKKSSCKKSCKKKFYKVNTNIVNNTCWTKNKIYVIENPIRVSSGVILTIEDGVTILLVNKTAVENVSIDNPNISTSTTPIELTVTGSCLIFESGSKLIAETIYVNSCDENYTVVESSNNCGLFFCGTQTASEYNFFNIGSKISLEKSSFTIKEIILNNIGSFSFLVRTPPATIPPPTTFVPYTISIQSQPGSTTDSPPTSTLNGVPFNAITVIGCDRSELNIERCIINNAGSNGLWAQNSLFNMRSLKIFGFQGNGLFLRNSVTDFTNKLSLVQTIEPTFPDYIGLLINIAEVVGNKPNVLPFPPNQFNLSKTIFLTSITLESGLKLFLSQEGIIFRDTVNVIENIPLTNFDSNNFGTYFNGKISEKIIFVRNEDPL